MTAAVVTRPPAGSCDLWLGDLGWYCGLSAAGLYLTGWRCPGHTPAAQAGRKETVPDPASTMTGIREAWERRYARKVEVAERRAKGLLVFRGPSGPGGRYTGADVDYDAVHRAQRAVGDVLEARRQAWLAGAG